MRGCESAVCRVCAGARHLQTPHSTSVPFAPEPQLSRRKPVRQIPIIAAILVAAVLAPVAASADRMWIGFHDDPVLRYDDPAKKANQIEVATTTNKATVLRTLVTWANIAPTKPVNAANSN